MLNDGPGMTGLSRRPYEMCALSQISQIGHFFGSGDNPWYVNLKGYYQFWREASGSGLEHLVDAGDTVTQIRHAAGD
jgi:hypothetical protein